MPKKPKKPCNYQGCRELVDEAYCGKHKPLKNREYNERRDNHHIYNSRKWRKIRDIVLRNNPICAMCNNKAAEIVDHIKEIRDGGNPYNTDNLQPLCRACHNRKTADERKKREGWG